MRSVVRTGVVVSLFVSFFVLFTVACWAADSAQMTANLTPQIKEISGKTRIDLDAARYPHFKSFVAGTDPDCEAYLSTKYAGNGDEEDGIAQVGLSLAPIYLKSRFSNKAVGDKSTAEFVPVSEFKYKLAIPKEYRKTAKVMVTWTMEVFGDSPEAIIIENNMCAGSWYGTSTQAFPEGYAVLSRCIVDGDKENPKGQAQISMPEGGDRTHVSVPPPPPAPSCEPVMTGSAVIMPEDFNGTLPASMTIEIYWKNDSPLDVYSPEKSRQMTVTLMPLDREL